MQTASIPIDGDDTLGDAGVGTETAEELKQRMQKEEELRVEHEKNLAEEEAAIQKEIEQEIQGV